MTCCGPVTVTEREAEIIKTFAQERDIRWRTLSNLRCGFLQGGRCAMYEVRPFACRAMGVIKEMPCPRQVGPLSFPADRAANEGWMSSSDRLLSDVMSDAP
ncbi:MAG: hypothetical protein A2V88_08935 [Elusimicrobia bacterium RBG_16_66_12]|nr:MAG: hypothetical protein A2V88_08935 [Elusimicrobia bacterium RBG_16_66_12]